MLQNNSKILLLENQWNAIVSKLPPEKALEVIEREIVRVKAENPGSGEVFSMEQRIHLLQQLGFNYQTALTLLQSNSGLQLDTQQKNFTPHKEITGILEARNTYQHSQTIVPQWQPTVPATTISTLTPSVDNSAVSRERGWAVVTGFVVACVVLVGATVFAPANSLNFFNPKVVTPQNSSKPPPRKLERAAKVGDKIGAFRVASGFGWRFHPVYKTRLFHNGADTPIPYGIPYRMPGVEGSSGSVKCWGGEGKNSKSAGGGYVATIASNDVRYKNMKILLMHLKPGSCIPGNHAAGAHIAEGGNSGISTGPHLHLTQRVNGKNVAPSLTPIREVLGNAN